MKTILSLFYTFTYSLDRSSVFISELSLVSGTSNCSVSLCYMDRCPVARPGSQDSVAMFLGKEVIHLNCGRVKFIFQGFMGSTGN